MTETSLPIPRTTLTQMATAYPQAEEDIRKAFKMLADAEDSLHTAFQNDRYYFTVGGRHGLDIREPDRTLLNLKHAAWRALVDKMGIKKALSIKRAQELED